MMHGLLATRGLMQPVKAGSGPSAPVSDDDALLLPVRLSILERQ